MSGRMRDRRLNKMADKHVGRNVRMFASIYVRQIVIWCDHSKKAILAFALNRVESMFSWWQNAHYPRMEYCPIFLHDLGKGALTPSQTVKAKRNFCLLHLSKQQFDPGFPHPAVWAWHMPPSRSITASVDYHDPGGMMQTTNQCCRVLFNLSSSRALQWFMIRDQVGLLGMFKMLTSY